MIFIVIFCMFLVVFMGILYYFQYTESVYKHNIQIEQEKVETADAQNKHLQDKISDLETQLEDISDNEYLPDGMSAEYVGDFICSSYCGEKYPHICGNGSGITASGAPFTPGLTIAVDTSIIPLGTVVYIEGIGIRVAQDTGGSVASNKIDVAVAGTHQDALNWDKYGYHKVWILKEA